MKQRFLLAVGLATAMTVLGASHTAVPNRYTAMPTPSTAAQVITEQPEGTAVKYKRSGEGIYVDGDFTFAAEQNARTTIVYDADGTTVYITNIFNDCNTLMGEAWVKGTLNADGTQITVPLGQALYHSATYDADVVLAWGTTSPVLDEMETLVAIDFTPDVSVTEVTYTVDPATGVITLDGGEGRLWMGSPDCYNATGLGCYWTDDNTFGSYLDWDLTLTPVVDAVPAVPANPTLWEDSWFDDGTEDGYSCFDFLLPTTDVDGNPIDPELLSYSIFTDGDELFTFEADTYTYDLTEDMTEIPYSIYHAGTDFDASRVYFYRTNTGDNPLFTERIGIQVYYTVDGVKNASEIVYTYLTPTSVENIAVSNPVTSERYYNVAGRSSAEPFEGMNIVVRTHADGTTSVAKVVK